MSILIPTLVVGITGLVIGFALIVVSNAFHVDVDERVAQVRDKLPGNNCGACGFAGCDAVAAAIVSGEAPVNACPVNNDANTSAIGDIMGVAAQSQERKVAQVKCSGSCEKSPEPVEYAGIRDCRSVVAAGLPVRACSFGCIGYGSCTNVCEYDAIHIKDGVAVVDVMKCRGCLMCVKECPKNLIEAVPLKKVYSVHCSSHDRGPAVRKVCTAGCIGCGICVKQCEHDAVKLANNVAHIDADKCVGCGKCAEKCPAKVIVPIR